jgi:hypothetical protein
MLSAFIGWYCYALYNCRNYFFYDTECLPSRWTCNLKSLIKNNYWCNKHIMEYQNGGICNGIPCKDFLN